ncbi:unnamed protein product [Enterobius vermicularis]|uniref:Uncharacterized protein n=1 Tax=Enterobius vermicularis TaxID=51028 RepID=A0A0N4V6P8_ENTVE|nr:unnamed protein product [Enterobius vermicularis]
MYTIRALEVLTDFGLGTAKLSEAVQGQSELYAIRHYYTCVWSRVMCGSGSSNALWGSHEIPFSLEMEASPVSEECGSASFRTSLCSADFVKHGLLSSTVKMNASIASQSKSACHVGCRNTEKSILRSSREVLTTDQYSARRSDMSLDPCTCYEADGCILAERIASESQE